MWKYNTTFIFAYMRSDCNDLKNFLQGSGLTLSNPIFLLTAYSPARICFGRERGWWITCNYPTVLTLKSLN